ncbi:hypothetical protein [Salininema proteolyticum]|uniref:Uncharacterized protein n=1 Tax=Salininema proteolyticum TaxID=1607685 RepID=A0ABV8U0K9_9ACTN
MSPVASTEEASREKGRAAVKKASGLYLVFGSLMSVVPLFIFLVDGVEHWWQWLIPAAGAVLLTVGIGLHRRERWAYWTALAVSALTVGTVVWAFLAEGGSLVGGLLTVLFYSCPLFYLARPDSLRYADRPFRSGRS